MNNMPKLPLSYSDYAAPCDLRLPQKALQYRLDYPPPLTTDRLLNGFNVTAWLFQDKAGKQDIRVALNTTIEELKQKFGPAATPDAEVGFHSEMIAAQWFRGKSHLQVLQIFSERIPCPNMCRPMLRSLFSGVPFYYYYDRRSWIGAGGKLIKYPADVLKSVYGLRR
jgi:hypothetical protein